MTLANIVSRDVPSTPGALSAETYPMPPIPAPDPATSRYSDRPLGWRIRASGAGGATMVLLTMVAAALVSWNIAALPTAKPAPLVMELLPLAAPPEPVHEVPEGPAQVEQAARKPVKAELPEIPVIVPQLAPPPSPTQPPAESRSEERRVGTEA